MLGARGWGDRNEDQQVTRAGLDTLNDSYRKRLLEEHRHHNNSGDKDIVLTTNGSSKPPDARQL